MSCSMNKVEDDNEWLLFLYRYNINHYLETGNSNLYIDEFTLSEGNDIADIVAELFMKHRLGWSHRACYVLQKATKKAWAIGMRNWVVSRVEEFEELVYD